MTGLWQLHVWSQVGQKGGLFWMGGGSGRGRTWEGPLWKFERVGCCLFVSSWAVGAEILWGLWGGESQVIEWGKGPAEARPERRCVPDERRGKAAGFLLQLLDGLQCPAKHPCQ